MITLEWWALILIVIGAVNTGMIVMSLFVVVGGMRK